ncbi:hypothetical protein ACYULU_06545 [Breznakiellaceae bacterium SP9]
MENREVRKENLIEELTVYAANNCKQNGTFPFVLERLQKEQATMSVTRLCQRVNVARSYYYKFRGEHAPNIPKDKVISFGLALELNRAQMDELLASAGYVLSNSFKYDVVVMFCIEHKLYDIDKLKEMAAGLNKRTAIALSQKADGKEKPQSIMKETGSSLESIFTAIADNIGSCLADFEKSFAGDASEKDWQEYCDNEEEQAEFASERIIDSMASMFENVANSLEAFSAQLNSIDSFAQSDNGEEPCLSEEEDAETTRMAEKISAPLVNKLNGITDLLNKAALDIAAFDEKE